MCNGTNGTPDLRDRFVVGAGSTYVVGGTGGSKDAVVVDHTHTGTAASGGSGGTFVTERFTRMATIPVGYADGYPRQLSNKGWVLIHGKKAPILGRVCMDQFMVDVTDIPEVKAGDEVTLMGRDGEEFISVETLGDLSGRILS